MKPEELRRFQEERLRAIVRHAYKYVPFYRRRWKEVGVRPEDVKTVEDLRKLPVITRDDVKKDAESIHATNINLNKCFSRSTSGSTGSPLRVFFDEKSWDYLEAVYARALFIAGYKPWNRLAYYWFPPFNKTKFYELLGIMKKHWLKYTIPEEEQIKRLEKIKPEVIYCFPSTLYLLARIIDEKNIETIKPKLIISHGEVLTKKYRKYISSVFECDIYDQYGSTEFNRMGWECEEHKGFHIDSDSIIIETMDIENGRGLEKIIVTGLFNRAMPFIRYDIGDMTSGVKDECSCGRVFPLLKGIEGRKDDFIVLPGNKIVAPRAVVHSIMNIKGIWKFRVVQEKIDSIEVLIVKNADFSEDTIKEVENRMKSIIKEDVSIEVKIVEDIPRNKHGKLRAVESKVKLKV
jgi:phenylacetate-CoA ligase